jgi:hypothetical protein
MWACAGLKEPFVEAVNSYARSVLVNTAAVSAASLAVGVVAGLLIGRYIGRGEKK